MSKKINKIPLGLLLQNADLISENQLQKALKIQSQYTQMKLGEILVLQEEVRAKTIDFFVNQWQDFVTQGQQFPIGYYLKNAALLDEQQITTILQEQKSNQQKFGILVAQKGWVKQSTINFLLDSLSNSPPHMSLNSLEEYNSNTLHLDKKYANYSLILSRILAWTGGNAILSKTICQVFAHADFNIPAGLEINAVDQFVEGSLIRKWQTSKTAEHIRSVKQNFVNSSRYDSSLLLQEYRTILLSDNQKYQHTPEQNELLKLGLIVEENNYLRVANIIYQQVFNQDFISQEIRKKQPINTDVTKLDVDRETPENTITKYTLDVLPTEVSQVSKEENISEIELDTNATKTVSNDADSEQNTSTPEPLTKMSSLITLAAIALLIPLFLTINNYYSSLLQSNEKSQDSLTESEKLNQFCDELDLSDSSASLSLISKLERRKQTLLDNPADNSATFPDNCEVALNRSRVLAAPQLGKENRILEAIRNLCKVPEDSEMYLDAEVWLKRWYNSANWGEETKFYLEEFAEYNNSDCPAAHFTEYDN